MTSLTEHSSVIVCSHFYSAAEIPREFVLPYMSFLSWSDSSIRARIAGVTWLPAIPRNEDTALISWHTTADFAWCPERYDPNASFGRAAARYLSTADK